ncbi:hypothetical protein HDU91_002896, partial [Kappamyces sp. JEL0680]
PSQELKSFKPVVSQRNGLSHIQFGQASHEARTTATSITQRDYVECQLAREPIVTAQSQRNNNGIQKAIRPTNASYPSGELQGPLPTAASIQAAGISYSGSKTTKNVSSVPEGDLRYYSTGATKSTSKDDFVSYPIVPRAKCTAQTEEVPTKARIFNDDLADSTFPTSYETTSQKEYVRYTESEAKSVRGLPYRPGSGSNARAGDNCFPREITTTQHAHFTAPREVARRVPHLPQIALPNRLFPLAAKASPNAYQTSFSSYFPAREELFFGKGHPEPAVLS